MKKSVPHLMDRFPKVPPRVRFVPIKATPYLIPSMPDLYYDPTCWKWYYYTNAFGWVETPRSNFINLNANLMYLRELAMLPIVRSNRLDLDTVLEEIDLICELMR